MSLYYKVWITNLLVQLVNKQMTHVYCTPAMKHADHSYWHAKWIWMQIQTQDRVTHLIYLHCLTIFAVIWMNPPGLHPQVLQYWISLFPICHGHLQRWKSMILSLCAITAQSKHHWSLQTNICQRPCKVPAWPAGRFHKQTLVPTRHRACGWGRITIRCLI